MSCQVWPEKYQQQLDEKRAQVLALMPDVEPLLSVYASQPTHYRMRAEFRVWHQGQEWQYAMFDVATKRPVFIEDCPMVTLVIADIMQPLRQALLGVEELSRKLYAIDFLASTLGEVLVTLIYQRPLDHAWDAAARSLTLPQGVMLLGRSRGKKRILVRDYVYERVSLPAGQQMTLHHVENAFSQPNAGVNAHMLAWVDAQVGQLPALRAALELYGGVGNFTWVLARHASTVVMTELSKQAVFAANTAFVSMDLHHVHIASMDSAQVSAALSSSGAGASLVWQEHNYDFDLILVDPPRAGLDALTQQLAQRFRYIVYISCNPDTLVRDLAVWSNTHEITAIALFDQFPYTHHIEMGVVLHQREN